MVVVDSKILISRVNPVEECLAKLNKLFALQFLNDEKGVNHIQDGLGGFVRKFPLKAIRSFYDFRSVIVNAATKVLNQVANTRIFCRGNSQVTTKTQRTSFFKSFFSDSKAALGIQVSSKIGEVQYGWKPTIAFGFNSIENVNVSDEGISFLKSRLTNGFSFFRSAIQERFNQFKLRAFLDQKVFKRFNLGKNVLTYVKSINVFLFPVVNFFAFSIESPSNILDKIFKRLFSSGSYHKFTAETFITILKIFLKTKMSVTVNVTSKIGKKLIGHVVP